MIDLVELKAALETIRLEKKSADDAQAAQDIIDSDARKVTATEYIKTLKLGVKDTLPLPEQKKAYYNNIDLLKSEIQKATYGELSQKLQNKIEVQMVQINLIKDQQRALKIGS